MKLLIFLNCFQALEINANHWPSLDCVITVLYALNNYEGNDKRVVILYGIETRLSLLQVIVAVCEAFFLILYLVFCPVVEVTQWIECWTCNQEVVSSNPTRGKAA